jgi:DNA-binding CsgD family transcriptional regulator
LPQTLYSAEGEPVASSESAAAPTLTEREREILMGAREGKSNQEIGLSLGISALTVKNHIQKILRKLGAHNRAHAVALAMSHDLFSRRAGSSRS